MSDVLNRECDKTFSVESDIKRQTLYAHLNNSVEQATLKPKKYVFPCEVCTAQFSTECKLMKHNVIHFGKKQFVCEICSKQFSRKCYLVEHLHIHTKEKPYVCKICFKQFFQKDSLRKHLLTHTEEKPFSCDTCSKKFYLKSYLNRHLHIHAKKKPFSCLICTKQFSQKINLHRHFRTHTKEKPFSCEICSRQFSQKHSLDLHFQVHITEKPFSCEICCKEFSLKSLLNSHLCYHSKEKSFSCEICSKRFYRKYSLKLHLRLHTQENLFSCEICSKRFSHQLYLNRHFLTHTKEKPYSCDICFKQFSQKSTLNKHIDIHTKENEVRECCVNNEYSSDVGNRTFQSASSETENMCSEMPSNISHPVESSSHNKYKCECYTCVTCNKLITSSSNWHFCTHTGNGPFLCNICSLRFKTFTTLEDHLFVSHVKTKPKYSQICPKYIKGQHTSQQLTCSKDFSCSKCGVVFLNQAQLNNHLSTHDGGKLYVCQTCSRTFKRGQDLITHSRRTHKIEVLIF